jgi:glycosyltransferase involved in cell wall biosynthesis
VVHNFAIKSVLYGAIAARSVGVAAVVGSITGLGYAFMPGGRRRAALTQGVTMAMRVALAGSHSRIIVQNPDDAAFFVERGVVTKERLSIVYGSGVDAQEFAPSPEPVGPPVVVLGARMLWDKGLGELVEAVRRLKLRGLSFRCLLLGDPDSHNPTSLTVAQLQEWVQQGLIEWQPRTDEVARHLREATLACLPSYREGLPLFLAEAAAAGRACVTTDVPGCRSVVEHGVTGLIVPARDATGLTEALAQLLGDTSLRQRMGENGRRLALERFSKEVVTRQIFAVYDSLL